jgi:hypothetical protein
MPSPGYIYLMGSAHLPDGVYKMGKTRRTPRERAAGLSTSVPGRFEVLSHRAVIDVAEAERLLFDLLAEHRVVDNREFFEVELEMAQRIMDYTADVINRAEIAMWRAFLALVRQDKLALIDDLCRSGCDINACDERGNGVLLSAVRFISPAAAIGLLNLGADPYRANHDGEDVFHKVGYFHRRDLGVVLRAWLADRPVQGQEPVTPGHQDRLNGVQMSGLGRSS